MINVTIPNNFLPERKYSISVILEQFLGLEIHVIESEVVEDYILEFSNSKLLIKDSFFSKFDKEYLSIGNIPKNSETAQNQYSEGCEVIFGNDLILEKGDNEIECQIDVFASAFFMLTRWEEICIEQKDKHGRTNESEMFAVKHKLHHRPIVNEWVELVWNMLVSLGYKGERRQHNYNPRITHDVDAISRYDSVKKLIHALGGDLILRKNPFLIFETLAQYLLVNLGLRKDNYDTTDWLMDISEEFNTKSHFYFIPSKSKEDDARYDIQSSHLSNIISNIESRGHIVGIHPSYNTFLNAGQFTIEVDRLKSVATNVKEGRQHYLRFSNPETWDMWDENGLTTDSTVGFALDVGFRAGVCLEYPVFNVLKRQQLKLMERPLIVMEGPLVNTYNGNSESLRIAKQLVDQCKKYNGEFVFLWHPENFNHRLWKPRTPLYRQILQYSKA
ncbi:polysaccharide deacetylase family protein [Salibacteraceae bacterium]|nr:polysaccharide deacetylase family protein [Salibacteraceae bacterium]